MDPEAGDLMIGPNNTLDVEDELIAAARQIVALLAELDNAGYAEDVLRIRWDRQRDAGLDHESGATISGAASAKMPSPATSNPTAPPIASARPRSRFDPT